MDAEATPMGVYDIGFECSCCLGVCWVLQCCVSSTAAFNLAIVFNQHRALYPKQLLNSMSRYKIQPHSTNSGLFSPL